MATLCYKGVEKLVSAADSSCRTQKEMTQVLNSARLLTRLIPYIFEEPDWRAFFWSAIPNAKETEEQVGPNIRYLLLNAFKPRGCDDDFPLN